MKSLNLLGILIFITYEIGAQIIIPVDPKMEAETSLNGQVALMGYSGPIGPIVPPPTHPNSIGVMGIGFTGVKGQAKADGGSGVYGETSKFAGRGVLGEATGTAGYGVYGSASGINGWGVYGRATGEGEWGGYFAGGKGLLARPRLGVENFDPQYPIHVGTNSGNGNGAHVTDGGSCVNGSSRTFKEDFQTINQDEILKNVAAIRVSKWHYKNSDEGAHIGPMAEDFYAAFGLGDDEKYIASTDADGIALASIQALYHRIIALEEKNLILEQRIIMLKFK